MANRSQTVSTVIKLTLPVKSMDTLYRLARVSNKPLATTLKHFVERSMPEMNEVIKILERANNLPKIDTSAMLESAQKKYVKPTTRKPRKVSASKSKTAVKPVKSGHAYIPPENLDLMLEPFNCEIPDKESLVQQLPKDAKKN